MFFFLTNFNQKNALLFEFSLKKCFYLGNFARLVIASQDFNTLTIADLERKKIIFLLSTLYFFILFVDKSSHLALKSTTPAKNLANSQLADLFNE